MLVKQFAFTEEELEMLQSIVLHEINSGAMSAGFYDSPDRTRLVLDIYDQLKGEFNRQPKTNVTNPKTNKSKKGDDPQTTKVPV